MRISRFSFHRSPAIGAMVALALGGVASADLVGHWEFEDSGDLGAATVGSDLTLNGAIGSTGGVDGGDGAASVPVGGYLTVPNPIGGNGGGAETNEYTLVVDLSFPSLAGWISIMDSESGGDGDYFYSSSRGLGVSSEGYVDDDDPPSSIQANTWHRLVLSIDNASVRTTYVDGVSQGNHAVGSVDGRWGLGAVFELFDDNGGGEEVITHVSRVALYDEPLDATEVAALGVAGDPLAGANQQPVIAEGTEVQLDAELNGPAVPLVLHASDPEGAPLTWSIPTQPVDGVAAIVTQSSVECTLSYTPDPGFTGLDPFVVRVSDGEGFSEITVNALVIDPSALPYPEPVGFWEFDFAIDPTLATLGNDLLLVGSLGTLPGQGGSDGSVDLGPGSHFILDHDIPAGTGGGSEVNEYTLLFDVRYPSSSPWKALFQTDTSNGNDGELFIRTGSGTVGTAAGLGGYSANATSTDTWYRIVMTVDNGSARKVYVDGAEWNGGNAGSLDDRYSLAETLLIFADENGEDGLIEVTNLAIWDEALTPAGIAALANAGDFIVNAPTPEPNSPPVITEGDSLPLPITANSGPHAVVVNATDADDAAVSWSISTLPANGTAQVVVAADLQVTIDYTPAADFIGSDSFTIRAEDEKASDEITVNVMVSNAAPEIGEGESFILNVPKNLSQALTLTVSDSDGNDLTWSVSSAPANGGVSIDSQSNVEATFIYTPMPDFTGIDAFTVAVTDGVATDYIVINVSVSDPTADPVLTIVAPHGTATPAPGSYPHPSGTELTPGVVGGTVGNTRHTPTGWTMIGNGPNSGTGSSFTMTLTRDSVLTWQFLTEYYIDTETSGNGTVDLADGWQSAEKPLAITATPDPGYYFAGWSGDTTGTLTGGTTLVLPMDREYGTITAHFALEEPFTVIALPDTQNYTSLGSPTDVFEHQTQWIIDNVVTENIRFVTHLGDIVNSPGNRGQWTRANTAMDLLNTTVPYGTCPGNHDIGDSTQNYLKFYGVNGVNEDETTPRWVDPVSGLAYDWYRGASPTGYSDYQVITVNGRDWMFLHMDIDARDQDIVWAQGVLDAHPTTLTVVTTHNYLAETGGGGASGTGTGERGRVPVQWVGGADRNNPNEVFNKLVKPNNQIFMVICGHNFAIYNLEETNDAGNVVHEVLVDYQTLPNGGNGFLRQMEFRPAEGKVVHSTYSPFLGRYWDKNIGADSQGMANLHDPDGSFFDMLIDFNGRFDSTLTVVSNPATVSPAVGAHPFADGTPVVISADAVVSGGTREVAAGWSVTGDTPASGSGSVATLVMDGDATLAWEWKTQHFLETSAIGDGIVSVASDWQDDGTMVEIIAQPDLGASFVQWSGDTAGAVLDGDRIRFTMDRPRGPVTAEFSGATGTYLVEVVSPHDTVTPAVGTFSYEPGAEVTFTAGDVDDGETRHVVTGYTLSGGKTGSGGGNSVTLTVDGNFTLTWEFQTQHRLLTEVSGPGSLSEEDPWIADGAAYALTAVPDEQASFVQWSGTTSGGTLDGDRFEIASMDGPLGPITAEFVRTQYTLTVVSPHGSSNYSPGDHDFDWGTEVTAEMADSASPSGRTRYLVSGYTLSGASTGGGSGSSATFVLTGDTTLTWTFDTQHLLEIAGGQEGLVVPLAAAGWYPENTLVNLDAIPESGFTLRRWNGDITGSETSVSQAVTLDQPRAVAPDFVPDMTVAGVPHWWLDKHAEVIGGDYETAELTDSDGDGMIAAEEFVAGMDDTDPARRFAAELKMAEGGVRLEWQSGDHRDYTILGSEDLGVFPDDMGTVAGRYPGSHADIDELTAARYFFRVDAALSPAPALADDPDAPALSHAPAKGALVREMVRIPAGTFTMGDNESGNATSRPEHEVTLSAYWMDKYEVTRSDWSAVVAWANAHGYDLPATLRVYDHVPDGDHPAVPITWHQAVKWCNARSEMEGREPVYFADTSGTTVYRSGVVDLTAAHVNWTGNGYRLPSEAEWEYAARGGLHQADYPWGGDSFLNRANVWQNLQALGEQFEDYPITRRVGYFDGTQPGGTGDQANGYGLYDMAGNAWEWVWDRNHTYDALPEFQPLGPDAGGTRIMRGGGWWYNGEDARTSHRRPFPPDGDDNEGTIGFRCIRAAHPNE